MTRAPLDLGRYTEAERRWALWLMEEPQQIGIGPVINGECAEGWRRKLIVRAIPSQIIRGEFGDRVLAYRLVGVQRTLDEWVVVRRGEVQYSTTEKAKAALEKIYIRANRPILGAHV